MVLDAHSQQELGAGLEDHPAVFPRGDPLGPGPGGTAGQDAGGNEIPGSVFALPEIAGGIRFRRQVGPGRRMAAHAAGDKVESCLI